MLINMFNDTYIILINNIIIIYKYVYNKYYQKHGITIAFLCSSRYSRWRDRETAKERDK